MKRIYRQSKPKTTASKSKSKSNKKSLAAAQPTALSPQLQDGYEKQNTLKKFDMNMAYGPCIGMSRLERWERAQRFGLNPPKEIESLLKDGKFNSECLWNGRF